MEKVNLAEKFGLFSDHWNPRIIGELNGSHIKVAKLKGEFDWHRHVAEEEMFLVVQGRLVIRFRDRDVTLDPGEFLVIPKGAEHMPVAENEVWVMLIEPIGTLNTGDVVTDKTRTHLETI